MSKPKPKDETESISDEEAKEMVCEAFDESKKVKTTHLRNTL